MDSNLWTVGDWVIYRKSKRSTSPGPRAQNVSPASQGETYSYTVDKYWIVTEVSERSLTVQTFRGKQHELSIDDTALRKPRLLERWWLRNRFREIEKSFHDRENSKANN